MILTQEQYDLVRSQIELVEHAREALRIYIGSKNMRNFEIFTEGYDDIIAELQAELDT